MLFNLTPPDIRLVIDPDAVPGGLEQWGEGALEVTVRGDTSLGHFFDLVGKLSGLPSVPRDFDAAQLERMRGAFRDFGATIVAWNIGGITPGAEGFEALPFPLAIAIFASWQQAAQPNPTSLGASRTGATSPAAAVRTGAS
jgi:hypothetical protein